MTLFDTTPGRWRSAATIVLEKICSVTWGTERESVDGIESTVPCATVKYSGDPCDYVWGDDVARLRQALTELSSTSDALAACQKLDALDCCEGYSLAEKDWPMFWEAISLARVAIAKASK